MHGCGNDYIYFDCLQTEPIDPHALELFWLCNRNIGIGSDGIVLILPSSTAFARMQMFNADGSQGLMCGNAIRCVAEYLHINHDAPNEISIETASGVKVIMKDLTRPHFWTVDMGRAIVEKPSSLHINTKEYRFTKVDVGNPHAVVFVENVSSFNVAEIGPLFEHNKAFLPHGVNTEFVEIISRNHLKMRVWERGSGETLACGTGACAAALAALQAGHCDMGADIKVELLGGALIINCTDETVLMTGEATQVFEGRLL